MELMPAWKRWGFEEGMEKGMEKGIELGIRTVAKKMLDKGFSPEQVADAVDLPLEEVGRLAKQ